MKKCYRVLFVLISILNTDLSAQNLTDIDTILFKSDSTKILFTKFGNLNLSGYIQAQYQKASSEGVKNFSGGDFSEYSDNRIMLRRARFKIDYLYSGDKMPIVFFALQVDATERGVVVRDMYGQLIDHKWKKISLFMGLFAKPFGFETNLSSGSRESPERGRMNQILFPRERDMGVMLNYHSLLNQGAWYDKIKVSVGLFNGSGLYTTSEQDNYKDIITRIQYLQLKLSPKLSLSAAASGYLGAIRSNNEQVYKFKNTGLSSTNETSNIGKRIDRKYYGADIQLKLKHAWGASEIRGEFIKGVQPANKNSTFTAISSSSDPVYIRPFAGAYFIFLQNIINTKHQVMIKYDIYDPNTTFGSNSSMDPSNYNLSDLRYDTWGFGYCYYMNRHCKLVIYYDWIKNEAIKAISSDLKDNILTARLHFSF